MNQTTSDFLNTENLGLNYSLVTHILSNLSQLTLSPLDLVSSHIEFYGDDYMK